MEGTVEKNPLILIYRDLKKSESRRLGKWLASPIHNQRGDVVALHNYLSTRVPFSKATRKTSDLAKTRIWKRLFHGEPYDDAKLRQTFHWALKATEEWLAYEHWTAEPINAQLALTRELRQRSLSAPLHRSLKKSHQLQGASTLRNEAYFRRQYLLELERDEYRSYHNLREEPNFQRIADTLDVNYLIEKLKVSCNMLYHQRVYRTSFDVKFLEETVSYVATLNLEELPALAIYYYVYRGLTEEDESGYNLKLLRDTLEQHAELLQVTDQRYVFLMAINLCIANANRGRASYIREMFEWYRLGFQRDVISDNSQLTQATYLNVVSNALKLKEYAWIADFLDTHTPQLDDEIRTNTENFARARLAYAQRQLDASQRLLAHVDFKHPVYNLLAKTLLLKIYYEQQEFDALDSLLDSITTYLRRKQLSEVQRQNFANIVRYVRQLSRLGPDGEDKLPAIREGITAEKYLSEKGWLLEMVG